MRLKYLKGKAIRVNWTGTSEYTMFEPFGETSDEKGQALLDNPKYASLFEKVTTEPDKPESKTELFKCETCGEFKKSKAGLGAHKRKHKEIET